MANDVSADGSVVVGESVVSTGDAVAFIWDSANGMRNLRDVLMNDFGLDLTGWVLQNPTSISDDGRTIVGWGTDPSGFTEAWIATIPEPGTLSLLGLAGVALLRRRRGRDCE